MYPVVRLALEPGKKYSIYQDNVVMSVSFPRAIRIIVVTSPVDVAVLVYNATRKVGVAWSTRCPFAAATSSTPLPPLPPQPALLYCISCRMRSIFICNICVCYGVCRRSRWDCRGWHVFNRKLLSAMTNSCSIASIYVPCVSIDIRNCSTNMLE